MKREVREVVKKENWYRFTDKEIVTLKACMDYIKLMDDSGCELPDGVNMAHVEEMRKYFLFEPKEKEQCEHEWVASVIEHNFNRGLKAICKKCGAIA